MSCIIRKAHDPVSMGVSCFVDGHISELEISDKIGYDDIGRVQRLATAVGRMEEKVRP